MPQKKYKPEAVVAKLRWGDVLLSQGRPVAETIRAIGVTAATLVDNVFASALSVNRIHALL